MKSKIEKIIATILMLYVFIGSIAFEIKYWKYIRIYVLIHGFKEYMPLIICALVSLGLFYKSNKSKESEDHTNANEV